MNELLFKTDDNKPIKNKPKVYFCCHPDDFSDTFDLICNDIFATHHCTIFYRKNMSEPLSEDGLNDDLEQMNLFVFPITKKLLTENSPAISTELPFAIQHQIRILPILMDSDAGNLPEFSRYFSTLQYLDRIHKDETGISYENKLKVFLDNTLLDDETMMLIHKEFDAYIFLSYRKKDRKYANDLMKRIHRNRQYISVSIWYDEYLVPGEKFDLSIQSAMNKSKLFMLLVTPSLFEKNNYVQQVEYPYAKEKNMPILPVEPVLPIERIEVDSDLLKNEYQGIPEVIFVDDENRLFGVISDHIDHYIKNINDCTDRFYLLGMAYLNGYDVEVNRDLGIELLSIAGDSGDIRAIEKLTDIYSYKNRFNRGLSQKYNRNALYWFHKQFDYYRKTLGEKNEKTLRLMYEIAISDDSLNNEQQITMLKKCMEYANEVFQEDDIFMLDLMVKIYKKTNKDPVERYKNLDKVFILAYKRYGTQKNEQGQCITDKYERLLSMIYSKVHFSKEKRMLILKECYEDRKKELGENDRYTQRMKKLLEKVENEPSDISTSELSSGNNTIEAEEKHNQSVDADAYFESYKTALCEKDYSKAEYIMYRLLWAIAGPENLEQRQKVLAYVCEAERKLYTDENMPPVAMSHLRELSSVYHQLGDYQKAVFYLRQYYEIGIKQNGENKTRSEMISNETERILAELYHEIGEYKKEAEMLCHLLEYDINLFEKDEIPQTPEQYEQYCQKFRVNDVANQFFTLCSEIQDFSALSELTEQYPILLSLLCSYAVYIHAQGNAKDAGYVIDMLLKNDRLEEKDRKRIENL